MNSVLYSVFISLALRMTVITVFVLIIKTVFKSKLSSKMHCLIWLIPCIQLLFCIGGIKIQTGASIYNIVPDMAAANVNTPIHSAAPQPADPRNIVTLIWIIGVIAITLWYLSVFFIYRSKVKKYPLIEDKGIIKSAEDIKCMLNISSAKKIELRFSDTAQTMPNLVILPHGYTDEEIYQILLHELCHYRHRDYAKMWAALAVLCLNWFNPLIWFAFRTFRADIEMMCDDKVLKLTDSKKLYARTLVKSAMMKNRFIPGAASVHNGKNEVKQRVKRIASLKKLKPIWTAAAACLCVTVSCLCLTDAVSVAVENTVDITATPIPAAVIPTAAPEAESAADMADESVQTGEDDYTDSYENTDADSGYTSYYAPADESYSPPVYENNEPAAEPEAEAAVTDTEDVSDGSEMGDAADDAGNKEIYELDDGRTVVLQYDGESVENGYIIN